MKLIKKRSKAFETNSSSTHSLVVCENISIDSDDILRKIASKISHTVYVVGAGEYGWEQCRYTNFANKVDYLYLYFENGGYDKETMPEFCANGPFFLAFVKDFFSERGYSIDFLVKVNENMNTPGYIDHQSIGDEGINEELTSQYSIMNFLLSDKNYVKTNNDNN